MPVATAVGKLMEFKTQHAAIKSNKLYNVFKPTQIIDS